MKDIPLYRAHVPSGAGAAIEKVLQSGQIAGDGNIPEFEEKLRKFLGAPHLALTAEFSHSIEMCLRMAGVGAGDTVLVPAIACLATTTPILQTGAKPIWCDIDPESGDFDPDEISRRRQTNTKAIVLYHWAGFPSDVERILRLSAEAGLKVVEDAGESMGAEIGGKRIGAHGSDYTVFSFSPVRHITTGEGAAITFRDPEQPAMAALWRRYGIPPKGFRDSRGELSSDCQLTIPGFHNYMNRMAGALGSLQMDYLPGIVETHRRNGSFYDRGLAQVPGLRLLRKTPGSIPSYWVYSFLCERRDDLLRKLRENHIYASQVHLRNDVYGCYGVPTADLEGTARFEREQLSIPCGWWVTEEDCETICATIRSGW